MAQVTFDAPALAAIARQAEEEVRLVVAPVAQDQMTPAQVQAAGDYPTFELTLHSGEAVISSFEEGNATVTLPYTLAQGQEAQGIVVWYLDQEGTLTPCQTSYDPEAGQVTFVTPHFSRYVIGYDESLLSRADLNLPVQEEAPAEASEATFPLPLVAAVAALVAAAMVLLGRKFLLRED